MIERECDKYIAPPALYYTDSQSKFDRAFVKCLRDGVYPGMKNLGIRYCGEPWRTMSGRLTRRRLELMMMFNVAMQRGGPYAAKGEVPLRKDHPNYKSYHWINFPLGEEA